MAPVSVLQHVPLFSLSRMKLRSSSNGKQNFCNFLSNNNAQLTLIRRIQVASFLGETLRDEGEKCIEISLLLYYAHSRAITFNQRNACA